MAADTRRGCEHAPTVRRRLVPARGLQRGREGYGGEMGGYHSSTKPESCRFQSWPDKPVPSNKHLRHGLRSHREYGKTGD